MAPSTDGYNRYRGLRGVAYNSGDHSYTLEEGSRVSEAELQGVGIFSEQRQADMLGVRGTTYVLASIGSQLGQFRPGEVIPITAAEAHIRQEEAKRAFELSISSKLRKKCSMPLRMELQNETDEWLKDVL